MKKFLFLLLLLPVFALCQQDTRIVTNCGYASESDAKDGVLIARAVNCIQNPDERFSSASYIHKSSGWCYSITYVCSTMDPAPNASPVVKGPIDTRSITKCGYSSGEAARIAGEKAQKTAILPDETWSSTTWDAHCTSNCCYTVTFMCTSQLPVYPRPTPKVIPALPAEKFTSCTKKVYGPNIWVGYPSCQDAENGATTWIQSKTSIILESVSTFEWGSGDGVENWGYEVVRFRSSVPK